MIAPARGRMKAGQTLRVDHARREAAPGGEWQDLDSLAQGRVHILAVAADNAAEAEAAWQNCNA